ncbi:MAG TPA: hypothetical protein VF175_12495 [Lacipirellula sp.]
MTRQFWNRAIALSAMLTLLNLGQASAVEYANINVADGAVQQSDPPTVTIGQGTAGFFIDSGAVVGEYPIRIGASAADDAAGGVLITTVTEYGRTTALANEVLYASTSVVADDDFTSTNTRNTSGGLAIVTDRAGSNVEPGSAFPSGAPFNANVNAGYFPFSEGWQGRSVSGALNGAAITVDALGAGDNLVTINGVEDSRRQGLLFSTTAVNKRNFSVVAPTVNGDGWNVTTRANNQDGGNAQTDPVSFVFLPLGTPNITMGAVFGSYGQNVQPYATLSSGQPFTVSSFQEPLPSDPSVMSTVYRLTIPGESPATGTLLMQSGGNVDGAGGTPADNLPTAEFVGGDWLLRFDDLPTANGNGQVASSNEAQPYFQFAFLPFDAPPTAPGAVPAVNSFKDDVIAFNAEVIEVTGLDNDNTDGTVGNYVNVPQGTAGFTYQGLRTNLGDNSVSIDNALPSTGDGVMLATVSEGLRINSATTGGLDGFGTVGVSTNGGPWEVHNGASDPGGGEFNVNFSAVLFGADTGFHMAAQEPTDAAGNLVISVPGVVDSRTEGVLMASNHGNDYQFVTVEPRSDGTGWILDNFNDSGVAVDGNVNYVYLPYTTENLVAGRVNADGTIVNSTDTGGFTLTAETVADLDGLGGTHLEYLLTIDGRTPDQGMLLLNSDGTGESNDNSLVYQPEGNAFRILGIDFIDTVEESAGGISQPEDTGFSFAFIDFVTAPSLPGGDFLAADFNEDGMVDGADLNAWESAFGPSNAGGDTDDDGDTDGADFLTWQRQLGTTPAAAPVAAAIPEPGSIALAMLAGLALVASRRR